MPSAAVYTPAGIAEVRGTTEDAWVGIWRRLHGQARSTSIARPPPPLFYPQILKSSKHSGKGFSYKFLHEWLGTGLLTSAGPKWKARYALIQPAPRRSTARTPDRGCCGVLSIRRRMITPSFHFEVLRGFVTTFAEQSDILVSLLKKEADTGKCAWFSIATHATAGGLLTEAPHPPRPQPPHPTPPHRPTPHQTQPQTPSGPVPVRRRPALSRL